MSALSVAYHPPRRRTRVPRRLDLVSRALFRAVMAADWQADSAAGSLLDLAEGDRRLLRLLRVRVERVLVERPTELARRAAATLDLAIGDRDVPARPRRAGADV